MDRLMAQTDELKHNPPVDRLIAGYFMSQGWWSQPETAEAPPAPGAAVITDGIWQSEMPEFVP